MTQIGSASSAFICG